MYIWKTESLATEIKENSLGRKEWKKYYLALTIFMTVALYLTALSPREAMLPLFVEAILSIGVLIFGIQVTYQSNRGDDGVDYIARITALSFPLTIKFFLLTLLLGGLMGFIAGATALVEGVIAWLMVGLVIMTQVAFFWRLNVHISFINNES